MLLGSDVANRTVGYARDTISSSRSHMKQSLDSDEIITACNAARGTSPFVARENERDGWHSHRSLRSAWRRAWPDGDVVRVATGIEVSRPAKRPLGRSGAHREGTSSRHLWAASEDWTRWDAAAKASAGRSWTEWARKALDSAAKRASKK